MEIGTDQAEIVAEALEETILIIAQEKCTKQFAQNAKKIVKFLSNPHKESQFIAKNVLQNKESFSLISN